MGVGLWDPSDRDCWPGNHPLSTTFSPAICPSGYTSACEPEGVTRRDESETVWACCPSGGFTCDHGVYSCCKTLSQDEGHYTLVIGTDNAGRKATTTVTTGVVINVHSVRVAFHSSDILGQVATMVDSPTPGATPAPTPTRPLSAPTSTTPTGTPSIQKAQALPASAWVSVGVGSTVGAILLFSGLIWSLRRYYRDKKRNAAVELPPGDRQSWTPKFFTRKPASELNAAPSLYELDTRAGQGRATGGWQQS